MAIIVEGYMDVVSLFELGQVVFPGADALLILVLVLKQK